MIAGSQIFSRIAAFLVFAGLILLIWVAVLLPAHNWKQNTFSALSASQSERDRLTASLARLQTERAQLSGGTSLDIVWQARKMGEATAMVQSEISKLAASHGVLLRSVTPLASRSLPFANSVGFRIEGEATLDRLTAFLVELEFNSPALVIERATLRRLNRPGRIAGQPDVFVQLNLIAPISLGEDEKT